jgi:membrane protease YdiL (CAAX protease family)
MSAVTGYVAVALLPLFYFEIPSLVVYPSHWLHRKTLVTLDAKAKVAKEGRLAPYLAEAMLGLSVWWLISSTSIPATAIGVSWTGWRRALAIGVLAGLIWLALYVSVLFVFRPRREQIAQHLLLQQSVLYWIPLSLSAAVVEEVWRGFCLVVLGHQGQIVGVVLTSVAAGWAHPHPRARAVSAAMFAIYAAELFLRTRSLWATVSAHAIVNVGTLCLIHVAFSRARKP